MKSDVDKRISWWRKKIGATTEQKNTINPMCKSKFLTANGDSYLVCSAIIAAFLITLRLHTISELLTQKSKLPPVFFIFLLQTPLDRPREKPLRNIIICHLWLAEMLKKIKTPNHFMITMPFNWELTELQQEKRFMHLRYIWGGLTSRGQGTVQ